MPNQHARPPTSIRLPQADAVWVAAYAAQTGRAFNAVIVEAVRRLRAEIDQPPAPVTGAGRVR